LLEGLLPVSLEYILETSDIIFLISFRGPNAVYKFGCNSFVFRASSQTTFSGILWSWNAKQWWSIVEPFYW